jgi:hypothetical protein
MGDPDCRDGSRVQSDLVPDRKLDFAAPAGVPADHGEGLLTETLLEAEWAAAQQKGPRDAAPLGNLALRLLD